MVLRVSLAAKGSSCTCVYIPFGSHSPPSCCKSKWPDGLPWALEQDVLVDPLRVQVFRSLAPQTPVLPTPAPSSRATSNLLSSPWVSFLCRESLVPFVRIPIRGVFCGLGLSLSDRLLFVGDCLKPSLWLRMSPLVLVGWLSLNPLGVCTTSP